MADRDSAVEEVFHFTMEVIFSAPKSVGPAPSPAAFDFAFGMQERSNTTL